MTAPLAEDLAHRGWTVWNVEYRRNGQGGWPATLDDCGAAVDHLVVLGDEFFFDAASTLILGHSAGGQLAVWSGGRGAVASREGRTQPVVRVDGVVSLAGVLDLARAARAKIGEGAVAGFVGGDPDQRPDRYREADPLQRLPTGVPVRCVHSRNDERVPFEQSVSYVGAARRSGDDAELIEVRGTHAEVIDVRNPTWMAVVDAIESLEEGPGRAADAKGDRG